jgi:hypothetical protein
MTKKAKVLIFFLLIFLVLVLYLILTSESSTKLNDFSQQAQDEKIVLLEENYKAKAKEFLSAYENLIKDNNFTAEKITELKNKLLDLKVPAKFKELHIQFVLALDRMENYLSQKDERKRSDSLRMVNQLKADYSWLNN